MFLEWPTALLAGSDQSSPSFPMKIYSTNTGETLSLLFHIYDGGAMLFNHLKYNNLV